MSHIGMSHVTHMNESSHQVAQADYGLEHMVYDINYKSAKLCKMAAIEVEKVQNILLAHTTTLTHVQLHYSRCFTRLDILNISSISFAR